MNNTLTNQFNNVLSQYQETYQKYLNSINDINSNANLITLENSALFGGTTINQNKLNDISDCSTSCMSDPSCNGANFSVENNICTLIKNPKNVLPANKITTLVNPALYYTYQLQQLNKQLTDINQQIIILVNQQENLNENTDKIIKQKEIVTKNYAILNEEREKITQMSNELNAIDTANNNSSLIVLMYYYRYIILILIVGLLIFMLIKFSSREQRGGSKKMFSFLHFWPIKPLLI
jgi:hypothetical protein